MNIELPKPYLSYSQLRLWLDNKQMYRSRYYMNATDSGSKYLLFGSEMAKGLEDGTITIPNLPVYPKSEEEIKLEVDGVMFFGYIDTFNPAIVKFREYKTGIKKPNGAPRWTQKDVDKHIQLDIYSLLIQLKYGSVDDECHLDWIHTRNKRKFMIDPFGFELWADSEELELTGEVTSFRRVISQDERDRARMMIVSIAREISNDYAAWKTTDQAKQYLSNAEPRIF